MFVTKESEDVVKGNVSEQRTDIEAEHGVRRGAQVTEELCEMLRVFDVGFGEGAEVWGEGGGKPCGQGVGSAALGRNSRAEGDVRLVDLREAVEIRKSGSLDEKAVEERGIRAELGNAF